MQRRSKLGLYDHISKFNRKKRIDGIAPSRHTCSMHQTIEPTILYFGTPVALISTLNEDGSANIAPMSSAWQRQAMSGL
jgi:flavin reductase (DIM6/NTAB) family NADH-FMN oxidoreductase RutF